MRTGYLMHPFAQAVRAATPGFKPLFVRVSALDGIDGAGAWMIPWPRPKN
jgi:hypothetical protein